MARPVGAVAENKCFVREAVRGGGVKQLSLASGVAYGLLGPMEQACGSAGGVGEEGRVRCGGWCGRMQCLVRMCVPPFAVLQQAGGMAVRCSFGKQGGLVRRAEVGWT